MPTRPKVARKALQTETARRIAAAAAYAGLDGKTALAKKLGWSAKTLVSRGKQERLLERDISAIADVTSVPREFLRHGWEGATWTSPADGPRDFDEPTSGAGQPNAPSPPPGANGQARPHEDVSP